MFEVFANYLRVNGGLTDEELRLVEAVTIPKRIRKRQYLLQEGTVSRYNTFITKGCLRLYRIGNDGAEHILRFAVEDWWISDYESYHSGLPSKFNIDALEDSELMLIEKENFDALCETIPRFRKLREKLDNKNFEVTQNRILSNISETTEEKYNNFVNMCPHIYNRVPLHMIASFLGVSRETLSRMRQQQQKKTGRLD